MKLCGTVIHGKKRGADLGFPTANIDVKDAQEIPGAGIYAGTTEIEGKSYLTAIHIGPRPTFQEKNSTIEAHILDFSGDLYGTQLCVTIQQKLRDVENFATLEALQEAIADDCNAVRQLLSHTI